MIVMGIDQARSSGYGIALALAVPTLHEVGTAKTAQHRAEVVQAALALAALHAVPLHVVFEDHSGIPASHGRGSPTLLGMGAARGRWEECLALAGVPAARYAHRVAPEIWRRAVLGLSSAASTDRAKATAVTYACAILGQTVEHDAAEALCITVWAARNVPMQLEYRRAAAALARRRRA